MSYFRRMFGPRIMLLRPVCYDLSAGYMKRHSLTLNELASKLGVKKIIVASSETTYGVCFAQGNADYHSFPLEEDYDVDPEDSYALSKICGEKTARTVSDSEVLQLPINIRRVKY
jgi:nucleoside-diphosphate-sugar epimerase